MLEVAPTSINRHRTGCALIIKARAAAAAIHHLWGQLLNGELLRRVSGIGAERKLDSHLGSSRFAPTADLRGHNPFLALDANRDSCSLEGCRPAQPWVVIGRSPGGGACGTNAVRYAVSAKTPSVTLGFAARSAGQTADFLSKL
jgi:hypothetical protein